MKNGLNRRVSVPNECRINIYDIKTKEIVYTGNAEKVGYFLGIGGGHASSAAGKKSRVKKKYALRYAKTEKK